MLNPKRNQSRSIWYLLCFVVWLVINIRVEAGAATVIERALDGLVGGIVLLVSIFMALRFFNDDGDAEWKKGEGRNRW